MPSQNLNDALRSLLTLATPMNLPPGITGYNRESVKDLAVVEPIILSSTLYYFLDYTFEGNRPHSGTKTALPLIHEDEVPLQVKPYSEWAPPPYSQQPSTFRERIFKAPDHCCVSIPRKTSLLRARLWMGLTPMSGGRWKERKLDNWLNWQFVFEFVYEILNVFLWLGDPDIQRTLQTHYNFIASELEIFQNAINARRAKIRIVQERVDLKSLWLEFVTSTFQTMVTRSHAWFHDRVQETIADAQAAYERAVQSHGAENSYEAAKKCGECWSDLSRLLNMADFTIMMPLDGFKGYTSSPSDSKTVGSLFPLPFRRDQRKDLEAAMSWPAAERSMDDIDSTRRMPLRFNAVINEGLTKHEEIRKQLRGEPIMLGREHWITIIHSRTEWSIGHGGPQDQRWGFVAYMLTHEPTEEQWTAFFTKLYADFARSGQWVEGFDQVKGKMDVQWIDGKDSGIPHDDIEAAKRHFRIFRNSPNKRRRAWGQDFLVIDTESFTSYMTPFPTSLPPTPSAPTSTTRPSHGDFGGFVKLIDLGIYRAELIAEQAAGYRNELKVLGSLIFEDVYPLIVSTAQRPHDLWMAAMLHPQQVYVGSTTESQEKGWDVVWKMREVVLKAFWRLVQRQTSGR